MNIPIGANVAHLMRSTATACLGLAMLLWAHGATAKPTFGVRWRVALPGPHRSFDEDSSFLPVVAHGLVFGQDRDRITTYDLATGAKRRGVKLAHQGLYAAGDALIAITADEELGLELETLRPTWHAPAPSFITTSGGMIYESAGHTHIVTARRPSDGVVLWTHPVDGDIRVVIADGDVVYVGADHVVALELATGAERWRHDGNLESAGGGRVALSDRGEAHVLGADGKEQLHVAGVSIRLDGDVGYEVDGAKGSVVAVDLPGGGVRWRRAEALEVVAADTTWVYALGNRTDPDGWSLVVLDRASGEVAARFAIGNPAPWRTGPSLPSGTRLVLGLGPTWLFALGDVDHVEAPREVRVSGRLRVSGCPQEGATLVAGATVTIAGVRAITDAHGRFRMRVRAGKAPEPLAVAKPDLHLDTPFPSVVVLDGKPLDLWAQYLGWGCDY
jgi:hypothetical protein